MPPSLKCLEPNQLLRYSDFGEMGHHQTRNQLWSPGGAKSFLKGAQIFQTMFNTFF